VPSSFLKAFFSDARLIASGKRSRTCDVVLLVIQSELLCTGYQRVISILRAASAPGNIGLCHLPLSTRRLVRISKSGSVDPLGRAYKLGSSQLRMSPAAHASRRKLDAGLVKNSSRHPAVNFLIESPQHFLGPLANFERHPCSRISLGVDGHRRPAYMGRLRFEYPKWDRAPPDGSSPLVRTSGNSLCLSLVIRSCFRSQNAQPHRRHADHLPSAVTLAQQMPAVETVRGSSWQVKQPRAWLDLGAKRSEVEASITPRW